MIPHKCVISSLVFILLIYIFLEEQKYSVKSQIIAGGLEANGDFAKSCKFIL
jgi:hypothetical protein